MAFINIVVLQKNSDHKNAIQQVYSSKHRTVIGYCVGCICRKYLNSLQEIFYVQQI